MLRVHQKFRGSLVNLNERSGFFEGISYSWQFIYLQLVILLVLVPQMLFPVGLK